MLRDKLHTLDPEALSYDEPKARKKRASGGIRGESLFHGRRQVRLRLAISGSGTRVCKLSRKIVALHVTV